MAVTRRNIPHGADGDLVRAEDRRRLERLGPPKASAVPQNLPAGIGQWSRWGLWQRMHQLLLAKLRGGDQLDWSRVLVDYGLVKASLGGLKRGRIPRIAAARR